MKILTYAISHDSGWMYYDTEVRRLYFFSAEREYNTKNATIREIDILKTAKNLFDFDKTKKDNVIIGWEYEYQHFLDRKKAKIYDNRLFKHVDKNLYTVDHHFAHILSSVALDDNIDVGISIDGKGDHKRRALVVKNIHDLDKIEYEIPEGNPPIGKLFSLFTSYLKINHDGLTATDNVISYQWDVGKAMGLQSYGKLNNELYNELISIEFCDTNIEIFESIFAKYSININIYDKATNFDIVYTYYQFLVERILELFGKYDFLKNNKIAYAGGVALSTVANKALLDAGYDITVCPAANDMGLAIGLMKFADIYFNLNIDFSVLIYSYFDDQQNIQVPLENLKFAAKTLAEGKIIAIAFGCGEVGPRALGHRSILMNPAIKNGKDFINEKVKHREWWRPFGGSTINTEIINNYKSSALDYYMLRNFEIKDEWKEKLNSIVHVDGSSRLQVLTQAHETEPLYKIISEFNNLTGIPAVLNTSFNIGGRPIPNYKKHVLETFKVLDNIDYLFYNDKIYYKEAGVIKEFTNVRREAL